MISWNLNAKESPSFYGHNFTLRAVRRAATWLNRPNFNRRKFRRRNSKLDTGFTLQEVDIEIAQSAARAEKNRLFNEEDLFTKMSNPWFDPTFKRRSKLNKARRTRLLAPFCTTDFDGWLRIFREYSARFAPSLQ